MTSKRRNTEQEMKLSKEEDFWQAELKDLIWLELQAWHADRTPMEQDCYICDARKSVPQLLVDILNYRFEKKPEQFSTQSSDSGIHLPTTENEAVVEEICESCSGCLWLFCSTCIEHENAALREIETLLSRLDAAESLYPSSRAFAEQYPLYKSAEFLNRVKIIGNNEDLEDYELHRYGHWSPEAQSLNLPSYRPAFLFISRIPLDVIHEFLRMRLETKLDKPSALSLRQLIKELKEGLRLAVLHKERYLQHVNTALCEEQNEVLETFHNSILSFDESVKSVLGLYLNYLEQWVYLAQHERVQKNILEEEWKFVTSTVPHIPGGHSLSGNSFWYSQLLDLLLNILIVSSVAPKKMTDKLA
ncbi:hypothetical protein AAG570_003765 [Ranatra chinensis]|uniref:Mitogen-activated protein kinase kinase kinase N-terminal domain-containing protein n=1 Tax=Ranatra chinensis TaxID=642074 RepID=A0ABD0Y4M9_9HEMI